MKQAQKYFEDIQNTDKISVDQKKWFEQWIRVEEYPCVMAKAVVKSENLVVNDYVNTTDADGLKKLSNDLKEFLEACKYLPKNKFASFIAVFSMESAETELIYENKLWDLLHRLNQIDPKEWDPSVSNDPTSPNYSYSHQGTAFYIVGMHKNSNRKARQTPYFTVVFNRHLQFETLREMGAYDSVRSRIRERDAIYSGSVNPMLADFGKGSVAIQYSGRNVNEDISKCPHLQGLKN